MINPFKSSKFKRNKEKFLAIFGAVILITFWLAGYLAQFSMDAFLSDEAHQTWNPFVCISAAIANPQVLGVFLLIYICIGFWAYLKYRDTHRIDTEADERGFDMEKSGVYGTSSLMKEDEIKEFLEVEPVERTTGTILGRLPDENGKGAVVSVSPDGRHYKYDALGRMAMKRTPQGPIPIREKFKSNTNKHIMVCGASGCGKSFCFARPAIFQAFKRRESVVITDPKGELYCDTAKYAEAMGYTVKIFNLFYLPGSDSWDCLAELKGSAQVGIEAQKFCHIIIENTGDPNAKGGGDPVYENAEESLLTALVLYVLTAPLYDGEQTLGAVATLLQSPEEDLAAKFNALGEDKAAKRSWNTYIGASPNLRGNIKLGLAARLKVLQDETVRQVTGFPDIDLTLPGKAPCAYYVIMPVMHSTYRFISSLFFSCLIDKLFEYSLQQKNQALPVPVNIIMDEFIAIGQIPDFEKKLATVRSAKISIAMIFQNLAQLEQEYPDNLWESLFSNCSTFICLACNDMTTAEYLAKRSGIGTVALENLRVDKPVIDFAAAPAQISHTYSTGERAVMQEAEIIKLASQNRVLVCPAGGDVFVLEKFPYTDLVDPSKLEQVNMVDHVPAWTLITQKQYTNEPQPQNIEGSYTRKSHQNIQQEPMPQGDDVPPVNETSTANQTTNIPQEKQQTDDEDFEDFDDPVESQAPSNSNAVPSSKDLIDDF